jgi:hypothetical protein
LKTWLGQEDAPRRQVARITVLPDTPPPPPPPPPKQEVKPPPLSDQAPPPQQQQQEQAPEAPAPIKMEGPAGSGDSPFQAGAVTNDYRGGAPVVGGTGGGGVDAAIDRAQHRFYAQSLRQQLQGELERRLRSGAVELEGDFSLWLQPDGRIQRWELAPGNDTSTDTDLRNALEASADSLRFAPPPAALMQPLRFRLNVRPSG